MYVYAAIVLGEKKNSRRPFTDTMTRRLVAVRFFEKIPVFKSVTFDFGRARRMKNARYYTGRIYRSSLYARTSRAF